MVKVAGQPSSASTPMTIPAVVICRCRAGTGPGHLDGIGSCGNANLVTRSSLLGPPEFSDRFQTGVA